MYEVEYEDTLCTPYQAAARGKWLCICVGVCACVCGGGVCVCVWWRCMCVCVMWVGVVNMLSACVFVCVCAQHTCASSIRKQNGL